APDNAAVVGASLAGIAERHEVLRTNFVAVAGRAEQVIAPPAPLPPPLPLIDLEELSAARREGVAQELAAAQARRPFDLARGPLVRTALLRLGPEEHAVVVVFHHAVADGWSLSIYVRELAALYTA